MYSRPMGTRDDLEVILGEIISEIAAAEEWVEELRLQRRGVEAVLSRLHLVPTAASQPQQEAPAPRQPSPSSRANSGNTAIVADILSESPDGMHLHMIEAKTAERGTPLDNEQVRGAVTYLKRVGRADRLNRGVWRLIPTDASGPVVAGPEGDASPDGEALQHRATDGASRQEHSSAARPQEEADLTASEASAFFLSGTSVPG